MARPISFARNAGGLLVPAGALTTFQARRDPDRPALTYGDVTLSRIELDRRANRMARALAAMGVVQDDFVTLALPNGIEMHMMVFALWKLGATPCPVSAKLPDREFREIVALENPRLVIGPEPDRLPGCRVLPAGFEPDPSLSDAPLPEVVARYWKATTSGGSTGRPKVIVDHRPSALDWTRPFLGIEPDDTVLIPSPLYHNAPFSNAQMALAAGAHVIGMARFDAEEVLRLIEVHRVRWITLVPTMMNRIWALGEEVRARYDQSSLEMVSHAASACPIWLKERWIEWLGADRIVEVYAGSEGIGGTAITGAEWLGHKGSVGRVLPHADLRILGPDGRACGPNEIGELYFLPKAGRNSSYHYLGATANADGDFESYGDLGYLDEDGYLYLADRRTDMIVSGGANIFPAEIEAALDEHPAVASSLVVGLPDDDMGALVHALIDWRGDGPPDPASLSAHLRERLATYKLPRSFEYATGPLRDDAGKARRSAIRDERITWLAEGRNFRLPVAPPV
jgi:bile acid-coenzyme A ligase